MTENLNLEALLRPHSVAVIGASKKSGSVGLGCLQNLSFVGYEGRVYPVNPRYEEIAGYRCYQDVRSLPEPPDCAVVCVPASAVEAVVREAASAGVRAAIVYAAGFAEIGGEGVALQCALREVSDAFRMPICGPNCLGVMNLRDRFAGFSAPTTVGLDRGRIAVVCQSGSVALALLNSGRGLAYSYVVSSGNEVVTTIEDYLDFFVDDDGTDLILAYVEGFRSIVKLRDVAIHAASKNKPIIVLKVGRSTGGKRASIAHTGALAGSDEAYNAFVTKWGLVTVSTLDEMMETAVLLQLAPRPAGDKVGIVAISGGETALVSDIADAVGLQFAQLTEETIGTLRSLLPPFSNITNPLDAWGLGDLGQTYAQCLEAIGRDPGVNLLAVCQDAQAGLGEKQADFYRSAIDSLVSASRNITKPLLLFSNLSGGFHPILRKRLEAERIPALQGTEESLLAIHHLIAYSKYRAKTVANPVTSRERKRVESINKWLTEPMLSEHQSKSVLAAYGIPVTREDCASSLEEACRIAETLKYPVAVKVDSADIPHKSAAGAVRLNVRDREDLAIAYADVLANARKEHQSARIAGVLVQEMVNLREAVELFAGIAHDQQYGSMILFGLGGQLVEVRKDIAARLVPLSEADARSMLSDFRGSSILAGSSANPPKDSEAVVRILLALSDLATDLEGDLKALDINPLFVYPQGRGAIVADALVVTSH